MNTLGFFAIYIELTQSILHMLSFSIHLMSILIKTIVSAESAKIFINQSNMKSSKWIELLNDSLVISQCNQQVYRRVKNDADKGNWTVLFRSEYWFWYRWMDDSEWVTLVSGWNGSGREPNWESGWASSSWCQIKINLQPMTDKNPKIGDDIEVLCENHLWMPMKFEWFHKEKIIFSDKTWTYCKDYPWRFPKDQKEEVTLRDWKTYIVEEIDGEKILKLKK